MAAELNLTISASETKNGVTFSSDFTGTVDVAGNTPIFEVKSIATSDTVLDLGGISTIGFCVFKNLDATNYVEIGDNNTTYSLKLKALEFCVVRWNQAAIHAKANTSAVLLQYLLIPN